jgi:probable rRNA maturation factor
MSVRLTPPAGRGLPRIDRRLLRSRAAKLLRALQRSGSELSIHLVDDEAIAALNAAYRGRKQPTDVLAFSLLEGEHAEHRGPLLGDVVIGIETAARQARAGRRTLDDEVARLLIHGTLHLLGHDHAEAGEARVMRGEERRLRQALGA